MFSVCLSVFVFSVSAEISPISINLTKYSSNCVAVVGNAPIVVSGSPSVTSNRFYQGVWPSGNSFRKFVLTLSCSSDLVSAKPSYIYDMCFDVYFEDSASLSKISLADVSIGDDSYNLTDYTTDSSGYRVYSFNHSYLGNEINSKLKNFGVVVNFSADITYTNVSIRNLRVVEHSPNEDIIANDDKNTEKIGGWISQAVSNLISGIMDILMDVFCPSLEYIQGFINDIDDFLVEHLGFLYYPFHVIVEILNSILEFNPTATPSITLPSLVVPVGEERYTLWEDTAYTFDIINTEPFKTVHTLYLAAVDCSLAFGLIMLFRKKLDEVMTR